MTTASPEVRPAAGEEDYEVAAEALALAFGHTGTFHLPAAAPPLWEMWREPR
jgi:hypothetical protein